ncbi:hypothetical protein N8611_00465 [bacterium]|nr:hypothetical protein [Verrucomicrobiota bacterium]MDA7667456.1 hypothetical protein [bacterium]
MPISVGVNRQKGVGPAKWPLFLLEGAVKYSLLLSEIDLVKSLSLREFITRMSFEKVLDRIPEFVDSEGDLGLERSFHKNYEILWFLW